MLWCKAAPPIILLTVVFAPQTTGTLDVVREAHLNIRLSRHPFAPKHLQIFVDLDAGTQELTC